MTSPNSDRWEAAYLAFETPEEEQRKFEKRLRALGVPAWDRRLSVLELFAGRGSALAAWESLGFRALDGLDLSHALAKRYAGAARYLVGDARRLPLRDGCRDVVAVQGGLHHLAGLEDLDLVMAEVRRVVSPAGHIVVVEPWLDSFLTAVHWVCRRRLARRISPRVDALATMIELEGGVYERWLATPGPILDVLRRHVRPLVLRVRFGKLFLLGSPLPRS